MLLISYLYKAGSGSRKVLNIRGLKQRYKIERKFGEAKRWHGFDRCRYIGFIRHAIQCYLTFIVLNLKRLVKLLTGVGFKSEARVCVMTGGINTPEIRRKRERWL